MKRSDRYTRIAHDAVAQTPVRELLDSRPAIVLERIARGGGETRWYCCRTAADLEVVEGRLRPGSLVSFYFDDRIRRTADSPAARREIEQAMASNHELVVAVTGPDGVELDALIFDAEDLAERPPGLELFCGEFPGRDNDGERAITVTLPDVDGVVRGHPH